MKKPLKTQPHPFSLLTLTPLPPPSSTTYASPSSLLSRLSLLPPPPPPPISTGSLPVNIPDWSKILKDDYKDNRRRDSDDDDEEDDCCDDGGGDRVPPHEFLARQLARMRIAAFSVHKGVGRTLKGRDLSRVRNAIWEKLLRALLLY